MRTITIQHNVYKFNELSDKAKEKAKEWCLENQDASIFADMIEEDLAFLFGRDSDLHVQFSLSYCQGDGLNIYGELPIKNFIECIENEKAGELKKYKDALSAEGKSKLLEYAEYVPSVELPENINYCYCKADCIEYYLYDSDIEEDIGEIDEQLVEKFNNILQGAFTTLCCHWEEAGYNFFYEISDDDMEELCEANEWEFYEDGSFY